MHGTIGGTFLKLNSFPTADIGITDNVMLNAKSQTKIYEPCSFNLIVNGEVFISLTGSTNQGDVSTITGDNINMIAESSFNDNHLSAKTTTYTGNNKILSIVLGRGGPISWPCQDQPDGHCYGFGRPGSVEIIPVD